MFNKERFHNELAMRLGYERIVNDRRIQISVDESEDPWVTLKFEGGEDVRFRVADNPEGIDAHITPEIKGIVDTIHQAYRKANSSLF